MFASITKGSAVGLVLPLLGIVKSIVLVPFLLSVLGEYSYGIYVLVATTLSYALIVAGFGLDSAMYRYVPANLPGDRGRSVMSAGIILACLCGGMVFLTGCIVSWVGPISEDLRLLPIVIGTICFAQALWSVCFAYERARDRLIWLVWASAIFTLLEFFVLVATAQIWRDVTSMFVGVLILNVSWAAIILFSQARSIGFSIPRREEIRAICAFGGHSVINTLVVGAFLTIDKFVLGFAAGPAILAFYAPAVGLALILGSLASLSLISIPHLLAEAHDRARIKDTRLIMRHGFNIYFYVAFPALLGLCVTAEPILKLLIGGPLAVKGAPIVIIFSLALFVLGMQRFPAQELRVRGHSNWVNFVAALSLALYVVAISAALLFDLRLPTAVPVIYLAITVLQTVWVWRKTATLTGFGVNFADVVPPVLAAIFCISPGIALDLTLGPVLAAYIAVAVLGYFASLAFWRHIEPVRFSYLR